MEVDHEVTSVTSPLYGFTGDSIIQRGKFNLAIEIGIAPFIAHYFMEFLVLDHRSTYHRVLGRPTLKELQAITSIHHLYMKFPTKNGVARSGTINKVLGNVIPTPF